MGCTDFTKNNKRIKYLLRCPFCGSMPVINYIEQRDWFMIDCQNIKCFVQPGTKAIKEATAIECWNVRVNEDDD